MDGTGKTQVAFETDGAQAVTTAVSWLSRLNFWLAGYDALAVIAARDNDHLLRDACLSREEVRDSLRPWRLVDFLLLPRRGGE